MVTRDLEILCDFQRHVLHEEVGEDREQGLRPCRVSLLPVHLAVCTVVDPMLWVQKPRPSELPGALSSRGRCCGGIGMQTRTSQRAPSVLLGGAPAGPACSWRSVGGMSEGMAKTAKPP